MDDPYNPLPASFIVDSSEYPVLQTPNSITATTIGSSTYALDMSEDGVQIINITDPYNPTAAWHILMKMALLSRHYVESPDGSSDNHYYHRLINVCHADSLDCMDL